VDPLHKWIGTYNIYREHLLRFFKWLHSPDIEPKKRSKPSVVDNIPELKRKEKSIYKPSDLWTQQDDLLFLKYCSSKRERCEKCADELIRNILGVERGRTDSSTGRSVNTSNGGLD
jgi:hypothetical protein